MLDSRAAAIVTQRRHLGKVRKARERLPDLKTVIVIDHDEDGKKLREGEVEYRMMDHREDRFPIAATYAESPSVLHYTSGTTGAPKGAMARARQRLRAVPHVEGGARHHGAGPLLVHGRSGWVTGTSYGIIGPWALGATQVVLDAGFSSDRWYETIEKHRVTVWYTAPTAIRMLMKDGIEPVKRRNLTSLRHMCSVGEPLNPRPCAGATRRSASGSTTRSGRPKPAPSS